MDNIAGKRSALVWAVHLSALLLVILWTVPTAGLLISSFRNADQIASSGWWNALVASERNFIVRAADPSTQREEGGRYVISGSVFGQGEGVVSAFGTTSVRPDAFAPGEIAGLSGDRTLTVAADGTYQLVSPTPFEGRSPRIFVTAVTPPEFTTANYERVLYAEGLGRAFLNTMTVAIPSTIIPILIAAFAAYALAWMEFPGRALLIAAIVGLFVVPLQLALIPLLQLHNQLGIGKEYLGIWLAHSGFGLPLAIYLLRNYMVGLPGEIIECARVDGASDFQIFRKIILPLSYPALASFAIFQFLWTWNDYLVSNVLLRLVGRPDYQEFPTTLVIAGQASASFGASEHLLTAGAFVQSAIPLVVFFLLQRYFVRGLLAGSVKG